LAIVITQVGNTLLNEFVGLVAALLWINPVVLTGADQLIRTILAALGAVYFIVTFSDKTAGAFGPCPGRTFLVTAALILAAEERSPGESFAPIGAFGDRNLALLGQTHFHECFTFLLARLLVVAVFEAAVESLFSDDAAKLRTGRWCASTAFLRASFCELPRKAATLVFRAFLLQTLSKNVPCACTTSFSTGRRCFRHAALDAAGAANFVGLRYTIVGWVSRVEAVLESDSGLMVTVTYAASLIVGWVDHIRFSEIG